MSDGGQEKTPEQLRAEISERLAELPTEILALETAMEEFGPKFDLAEFKPAFEKKAGMRAYNKVQAVERAFSRVQNYVVELAIDGSVLANLELPQSHEGTAARAKFLTPYGEWIKSKL